LFGIICQFCHGEKISGHFSQTRKDLPLCTGHHFALVPSTHNTVFIFAGIFLNDVETFEVKLFNIFLTSVTLFCTQFKNYIKSIFYFSYHKVYKSYKSICNIFSCLYNKILHSNKYSFVVCKKKVIFITISAIINHITFHKFNQA
jgi:hypothetical protein